MSKLLDVLGGGVLKTVLDTATKYFPPDATEAEKLQFNLQMQAVLNDAAQHLDQRIKEQEGTAKDLKQMPYLGRPIIFLRGVQRPAWGFFTMWLDARWFFELHDFSEQQQTAMIVINVLVLGFLFGERTIKNLEPLIIKVFAKG